MSRIVLLIAIATCPVFGQNLSKPEQNFEAFWEMFDKRYTFFEKRGVNWQQQYNKFRPRVTADTSKDKLFQILSNMVRPLRDGHVSIRGSGNEFSAGDGTLYFYNEFDDDEIDELFEVSGETLALAGFSRVRKRGPILRYATSDDFGYVRILAFDGISNGKLRRNLDRLMSDFSNAEGIIVDIRDNPGGFDSVALTIANRFTDTRRLGHTKQTQRSPGDFTSPKSIFLEPHNDQPFSKPIVLLTNDASASAADVFALVMKQLPHVTIVGDRTEGIFSDTLERKLPNGWRYSLSHQRYFSPAGDCYEGDGVPVDIEILNTLDDLETRVDPVVSMAIDVLMMNTASP